MFDLILKNVHWLWISIFCVLQNMRKVRYKCKVKKGFFIVYFGRYVVFGFKLDFDDILKKMSYINCHFNQIAMGWKPYLCEGLYKRKHRLWDYI